MNRKRPAPWSLRTSMVIYPYPIRLRGPWEAEVLSPDESSDLARPVCTRVSMPARREDLHLVNRPARIRFRRRFGIPRQIDDFERVWIIATRLQGASEFSLNGQPLGQAAGSTFEADVTPLLQSRNEVTIEIEVGPVDDLIGGDVALEIRCKAYLRAVSVEPRHVEAGREVVVSGELVGKCDGPLELYVLYRGRTVGYQPIVANAAGTPFRMTAPIEESGERPPVDDIHSEIRVDLVQVSSIWHRFETGPLDWRP